MPAAAARTRTRRSSGGGVPLVPLDPDAPTPLYEQLYRELRDQLTSGRLRPGVRIASSRTLALELGVSRFTVVTAMERLLAEGYLQGRRGAGTFVADVLPERRMRPSPAPPASRQGRVVNRAKAPTLSARGTAMSAVVITGPRLERGEPRPFRPRRPALDVFPARTWARLLANQWKRPLHEHLDYGEPAGFAPLRRAIADHIGVSRGVRCTAHQVIVTSGAQQAFDILFRLLLDPGDKAWIEEPGYLDVRGALVAAGARIVPVRVDAQGIDVARGVRLASDARLAIVSPSHQYPSGATLAASRRAELLHWARTTGAWVVEDDYDSYFRYRGRPLSALQRLDADVVTEQGPSPRVLYVGTFSKTMFPSLRLGFCVVPDSLVEAVANARALADRNSPIADQAAMAAFIMDGHYDRHLRRLRLVYQERYEAMRLHFARELDGLVSLAPSSAGTHVLGWLDHRWTADDRDVSAAVSVSRAAANDDLVVFPLSRYCMVPPKRDALVLGYGGLTPAQIGAGARRLAQTMETSARRASIR